MKSICLSLTLLLCGLFSVLQAQNRPDYFKAAPPSVEAAQNMNLPAWALEMYQEDPDVVLVDQLFQEYFETHPFIETTHTRNYKFWRRSIQPWLSPKGKIRRPEPAVFLAQFKDQEETDALKVLPWIPIGPFETYTEGSQGSFPVSWQVNVYCMDQSVSNPDILYAGTEAGGLFKSTNKGLSWELISAQTSILTVQDVKVAPDNPDLVFCASNDIVYRSEDGGTSWEEMFELGSGIYQLEFDPSNTQTLYCASQAGLFRSYNAGEDWDQPLAGTCWDVKFHPANPSNIYVLRNNAGASQCDFYKSADGGASWQKKENGWYVPENPTEAQDIGARIAVTPADPDRVYVALIGQSKEGDNGWIGLYSSFDAGESWANPNLPDGGPYNNDTHQNLATINKDGTGFHQGFYNFGIAASHIDPDRVFVGCLSLNVSQDAGSSWTRIGGYSAGSNDIGWVHPDVQDLHVLGGDVWVCTDGGINYSNDELQSHESRKTGIYGSDYWGFGQGWNQDVLVGGRYHNGNGGYYQTYGVGNHLRLGGAEAPTGYVNPLHERKAYFSDISTKVLPEMIDGPVPQLGSLGLYPNESYFTSYSSELVNDPRYANHFFMGKDNQIFKSVNEGGLFEAIFTFPQEGRVLEIEICRSNPDIMYCVFQEGASYWDDCKIYKSINGGTAWSALPDLPTNNTFRLEITVNPEDASEIWAIGVDSDPDKKVFQSTTGGVSWEDRSSPEVNEGSMRDIWYQAGTNSLVYVVTTRGVFYWNADSESWVDYSGGLPQRTRALEMIPFYRDSKLRLSTTGRGLWEAPMPAGFTPIAQPMTESDKVYCSRDTVQFDCYSILNHQSASWSWTFDPEPEWVSGTDIRNPKVVFGGEGTFDVSLTITDITGNTSSQMVPEMVTVENYCLLDTVPGFSMELVNSGDYATTDAFEGETNTFTLTAWIKPNGNQSEYSGIVMNNNTAAGLNFKSDNELGYHWPGGAWWWNSGLTAPSGEWSYVALVATPDSITVYLNGEASTHVTTLDPVALSTFNIGSYQGWGGRNVFGEIDEVCMWNRSLSRDEIREMRHLTKSADITADPDLLAYYQFNAPEGDVLDRAGVSHATLRGGASRVISSVPVAGGEVFRGNLSNTDPFTFGDTGMSIDYTESSSYPEGELVVSRLHWTPYNKPSQNPDAGLYWIVNHYGEGDFWGMDYVRFMLPFGEWYPGLTDQPENAVLYLRVPNGDEPNWFTLCEASELTDVLSFSESCNISAFGQLFIQSSDEDFPLIDDGSFSSVQYQPVAGIKVYPNPAAGQITIEHPEGGAMRFRMFDARGKLRFDQFCAGRQSDLVLPDLADGMYYYELQGSDFIKTGKLVIHK
ncbi:MAG: T9SS type A sorting domain-containing protein [Bacteroidetes bacterium]|nr:T9SS type A sorting domain-containing protein [Bacteroidota bacterium]